jgi:hypothetical protein
MMILSYPKDLISNNFFEEVVDGEFDKVI